MKKITLTVVSMLLIGTISTMLFYREQKHRENRSNPFVATSDVTDLPLNASSVTWVSNAMTIDQLVLESDIVVRARVAEAPITRVISSELPVWDENGNIVDTIISEVFFSDTTFEVLKTYVGKVSTKILVMQTGGLDPTGLRGIEEIADDPLYKIGEEYILFLVDISGDPVHAPDRQLYRIVNPFGRYRVDGTTVSSYGQNLRSIQLPTDIGELENQIIQFAQEYNK